MESIEKNQLKFEDYSNFIVPESNFTDIDDAINNYCTDLDIFQGKDYQRR